jgi:peptidoglycan/xylan/chitin deacetylase (PgdA/CDA1 family)
MRPWRWLAALSLLALVFAGLWKLSNSRTYQVFGKLIASLPCSEPLVALTLDDGPTPEGTGPLIDLLAQHAVSATFFLVGRELQQFPELGRRIVHAGHELGNHSYTHARMLLRTQDFVRRELEATDMAIRAAGQQGEILFRPPYGKKLFGLPWYLEQTGRTTLMWNLEPESAPDVGPRPEKHTPEDEVRYVLDHLLPGSIVLLHAMRDPDGFKHRVLEQLLPAVQQRGYRWVTAAELLRQCSAHAP